MELFTQPLHPATELAFQIWAWIAGIWFVWWVIMKITGANKMIEEAKYLPGGMYYDETEEEKAAREELEYRAHA